jgi:hypothetical protein
MENKNTQPSSSGKNQKTWSPGEDFGKFKARPPSLGKGIAKFVGGPVIVLLNIKLFRPSIFYYAVWILGVALFLGGIAEIVESKTKRKN